jgi:predicted Kef-type K+ transport protein
MMHSVTLITTIAAGFGLALIFGFLAVRPGLPALIGYLLAGVVLGPATPGYVADLEIAGQLAEIGVMLLMPASGAFFVPGFAVRAPHALPGAIVRSRWLRRSARVSRRSGAGNCRPASYSASRCRSRARSCCCARWKSRGEL